MVIKPIVVVGSINTDMVIRVDRIPKRGETILGGDFVSAGGGKGANQALAAARAGGQVTFVARIGLDIFGHHALAALAKAGIGTDYIVRDQLNPSGMAFILVAPDGENSIAVAPGANAKLSPSDVKKASSVLHKAGMLIMQLEIPIDTVVKSAEMAFQASVAVMLNPAPARELPHALLRLISILTPNESEAEILTGIKIKHESDALKAADALIALGVQTVVITMGAKGAFLAHGDERCLIPGFKVDTVDTTAAGDVFNGALAVALTKSKCLREAVHFANAAAALSVMVLGAQASIPMRCSIDNLVRANTMFCR